MAYKGFFKPKNPKKYIGNPKAIVYRSRWESVFMSYLDNHDSVLEWASEELIIPYISQVDGKRHRYFPDFWVKVQQKDGTTKIMVVEIKPHKQTQPPKPGKNKARYISEAQTYIINSNKWDAAKAFCQSKGWTFSIVTENELGLKF